MLLKHLFIIIAIVDVVVVTVINCKKLEFYKHSVRAISDHTYKTANIILL